LIFDVFTEYFWAVLGKTVALEIRRVVVDGCICSNFYGSLFVNRIEINRHWILVFLGCSIVGNVVCFSEFDLTKINCKAVVACKRIVEQGER